MELKELENAREMTLNLESYLKDIGLYYLSGSVRAIALTLREEAQKVSG